MQFLRARESKSLQFFPDCLILVSSAWLHLLSVWHSSTKVATEISSAGKITTLAMLPAQVFSAVHLYSQHKYYSFRAGEEAIIIVRKYDIWTMLHIPSEAIYGRYAIGHKNDFQGTIKFYENFSHLSEGSTIAKVFSSHSSPPTSPSGHLLALLAGIALWKHPVLTVVVRRSDQL